MYRTQTYNVLSLSSIFAVTETPSGVFGGLKFTPKSANQPANGTETRGDTIGISQNTSGWGGGVTTKGPESHDVWGGTASENKSDIASVRWGGGGSGAFGGASRGGWRGGGGGSFGGRGGGFSNGRGEWSHGDPNGGYRGGVRKTGEGGGWGDGEGAGGEDGVETVTPTP